MVEVVHNNENENASKESDLVQHEVNNDGNVQGFDMDKLSENLEKIILEKVEAATAPLKKEIKTLRGVSFSAKQAAEKNASNVINNSVTGKEVEVQAEDPTPLNPGVKDEVENVTKPEALNEDMLKEFFKFKAGQVLDKTISDEESEKLIPILNLGIDIHTAYKMISGEKASDTSVKKDKSNAPMPKTGVTQMPVRKNIFDGI